MNERIFAACIIAASRSYDRYNPVAVIDSAKVMYDCAMEIIREENKK